MWLCYKEAYNEVNQQLLMGYTYVLLQAIFLNVSLWKNPLHYSEDATRVIQVRHMSKTNINVLKLYVQDSTVKI